ncbi:unnamed protein product [Acanthoscelides obtectus]|uniref:BESS domain-containing protein n=1 Tax=Acanthoscelides obtectus TaxID=200917 RepID=A0A9P0MLS4_ACAOB|nr:unnamed protein product [Acanthoscelides obtectus]CAK1682750.1 hypothetical protein AOBTE_LOCUS33850 [Acanthoscelides obtectus]
MTFEEDLINQVRLHPVVWNKKSEDYKNRLKSEKAWDIIARNVNKTKTGNNDNDASLPTTSRSEQNLQWPDEENSTALSNRSDFVTSDEEPLSTSASSIHRDRDICPQKLWIVYHKLGLNKENAKKMIQIEEDKIKVFKEKDKEAEDEDILFLKSLAPYFKYLNPVQKLRLKSKLQNTIANEISLAMPSPPSNSSATMSMSIIPHQCTL